jgi:hypothetical protein
MEIHSLKLIITEADVNALATKALAQESQVRDVQVQLEPAGMRVLGVYPTPFMSVRFQTVWEPSIQNGKVAVRLTELKVVGVPAGMLRGLLMGALADAVSKEDAVSIQGDTLLLDPDRLLSKHVPDSRTNLTAIHCETGRIVIEAASSA